MATTVRKYGWKKDIEDRRDFKFSIQRPAQQIMLPEQFDLFSTRFEPPIYNQGSIGSCTGNGVAEDVTYALHKQNIVNITPSRLFIYFNGRRLEGTTLQDAGASIRDAIKTINVWGVCDESYWPYVETKYNETPPDTAYTEAAKTKSILYRSIKQDLYSLKKCIYDGWPIVFGFMVYSYFESDQMEKDGLLQMPSFSERILGGHCVVKGGWDDNKIIGRCKGAFKIRNSWGSDWGQSGYFWMPYDYALDARLASDFWQIESMS